MSGILLSRLQRRVRVRDGLDAALTLSPAVAAAAVAAWRLGGAPTAAVLAAVGGAAAAVAVIARSRRFDLPWLVRRLDRLRPDLEDSADLLAIPRSGLPPLQRLQRDRLEARFSGAGGPDPRPAWSTRRIATAWLAALAVSAVVVAWPRTSGLVPAADGPPPPVGAPRLVAYRLHVVPPAYTGLPARDLPGLDAQVPQGSRLTWTLRFDPQPGGGQLAVTAGPSPALRRAGGDWTAALTLDRSLLYRVSVDGGRAPAPPLHRLEAVADTPPQVRVLQPAQTLTTVAGDQRSWPLLFEASDDYGVAADAVLRLTFAEGEGEQVSFHERRLTLHGSGPPRLRRFATTLDLAALGFRRGGDLVAQLLVADDRAPSPQTTASPSLILRWPSAPEAAGDGLDGAVKRMPAAYLRSERQIIIDAEQLLKERPGLPPARFLARSDGIGADQQGLRLRYSQFLGGEAEHAENALPTSDDDDAPSAPSAAPAPARPFGAEGDVTRTYGHAHDDTESAAVEPSTRTKLKLSVDQMWAAETRLRQGDPAGALPFANRALVLLKEAQQAERVFVPHTGLKPPPIDETRRLTGKRDGLERDALQLAPPDPVDPVPLAAWRALSDAPGLGVDPAPSLAALERWLSTDAAAARARGADPLAIAAAIDAVRRDPRCGRCRRELRGQVWTLLPRPSAHVGRRPEPDVAGRRYLDALGGGARR